MVDSKDNFITRPSNAKQQQIRLGFYGIAEFPNIIGGVYGTLVRIQDPSEDKPSFVNRKMYHNINLQVICDNDGDSLIFLYRNFTDIVRTLLCK